LIPLISVKLLATLLMAYAVLPTLLARADEVIE
jgi:hypothetical protein